MLNKFKTFLIRSMQGRNGPDSISRSLFVPIIFLMILSAVVNNSIIKIISIFLLWALVFYMYFRIFSKNIYKRRSENDAYEKRINYLKRRIKERKDYRFFDCPNCHTHLRVPKGKGNIIITCSKCQTKFERKV